MGRTCAAVGVIANPAAGKDIRRLVAQGRYVTNHEKSNIISRALAGIASVGVRRVVVMPDLDGLGRRAINERDASLEVEFLDMPVLSDESDSTRAAREMRRMGVGCVITLGGDGTNRAVAKASGDIPIVAVSTGTNNVFPSMIEGTAAGIAAALVASGQADLTAATRRAMALEVSVDGQPPDLALVDVAISSHRFIGARALWDIETISELVLARAPADAIGLSAIGARLRPEYPTTRTALRVKLGEGGIVVRAPIAPGKVVEAPVAEWGVLEVGESVEIAHRRGAIALDGERAINIMERQTARITLTDNGPVVVDIEAAIRDATLRGAFSAREP